MMSVHYRNNKNLFNKNAKKKGFDIAYGGWIPPSCCSLLINFIQCQLKDISLTLEILQTTLTVNIIWNHV
jgi:hypothetical protein